MRGLIWPLVKGVMDFGQEGLTSDMLTWAFEHEDGKNPFCTPGAQPEDSLTSDCGTGVGTRCGECVEPRSA